jgi:uncharacterized protein
VRSHLLEGKVHHRRLRPFVYDLEHGVYYLALDLDELDEVARRRRLLSRNRPALLCFRDADHLQPPATDVAAELRAHLLAQGFDPTGWRITLITYPRVLGHVFNPASFFLCRDEARELRVVVVEVHNTYGERHLYTLRPEKKNATHVATMEKDFYVSPFIDVSGGYVVRVQDNPAGLRIAIDQRSEGSVLLHTSLALRRLPLTDSNLLRMLVRHPFVTLKTIGMIHWHALQLWRRGARFHRHSAYRRSPAPSPAASTHRTGEAAH